jgi:Leucine-rich repeat (LRR) protein
MKRIASIIILLFTFALIAKAQVSEQEFQALKAFYNATGGNNWTDRTGWVNINTTATKDDVTTAWVGIKRIVDGHITSLNFYDNNLTGILPEEIGNMQWLTSLVVHNNKLQSPLPQSLKTLTTLNVVNLSSNNLNIPFPSDFIISWPDLSELRLYSCGLTGQIEDIFMHVPGLSDLSVSDNNLTGNLPSSLNLLNLHAFDCSTNLLSGELPSLENTTQIYRLNLGNNQFTGSIPDHYGTFSLQYLYVQSNNLSGQIPVGLFKEGFTNLNIEENYFTFDGIEPVFTQINSLPEKRYSTTKKFPVSSTINTSNAGEPLVLDAVELSVYSLGGNNNRYKWFKNNVEIYSGNSPELNISESAKTDAGTYRFEVTNTVVAGITLKSENIVVNVQSDNHPPTDILLSQTHVDENFRGVLGLLTAADFDIDDDHVFTLSPGDGTNDINNNSFTIEEGNQLYNWNNWNYEEIKTVKINISVDDGNGGVYNKAFVITVNDVNETPDFSYQSSVSKTIDENVANGTTVFTLDARDPEKDNITYMIESGNEDGAFGIENNKLNVVDNSKFNYDSKKSYSLIVNASDGTLSSTTTLTVNLNKINRMPEVQNATFTIDENSPAGTVVGSILATDREGDPLTYTISSGNELGAFTLSGNSLIVANNEHLDFERHPLFTLVINVSDGVSIVPANITISLNNIQELTDNDILTFSVPGIVGDAVIDNSSHTVRAYVSNVDLRSLVATFTLSSQANANPESGTTFDFSTPQTVTITSQSGDAQVWTITVTYRTGIEAEEIQQMKIYPNPVADYLFVEGVTGGELIRIYTGKGQMVYEQEVTACPIQINTNNWPVGYYVIQTSSGEKHLTYSFIKK